MSFPGIELIENLEALSDAVDAANAATTQSSQDAAITSMTILCQGFIGMALDAPPGSTGFAAVVGVAQGMLGAIAAKNACTLASTGVVNTFSTMSDNFNEWLQERFDALSPTTQQSTDFASVLTAMNAANMTSFVVAANSCLEDFGLAHISVDATHAFTATDSHGVSGLPSWLSSLHTAFEGALTYPQTSPLVLDLDGDGVELTSLTGGGAAPVYWDIDNDGFREASAWVKPDDGLLVRDLNSNGVIDNHSELFGTNTTNGFTALAALDSNLSGTITSADTNWSSLKVWKDTNQDGISQSGELFSLASLGITSISVSPSTVSYSLAGNPVTHEASFVMGGTSHTIVDAWFNYDNINSIQQGSYTLDLTAAVLPNLRGYGTLSDLTRAMSEDGDLLTKVEAIADLDIIANPGDAAGLVQDALYQWAGVQGVDPDDRGTGSGWPDIDARDIRFTEKLFDELSTPSVTDAVWGPRGTGVEDVFREFETAATARLLLPLFGEQFFSATPTYDPVADIVDRGEEAAATNGFLLMNTRNDYLKDVRVRRALAYAIDRDGILRNALFGEGKVAHSPVSSGLGWIYTAAFDYPFDPAKSNQLLDEAGFKRDASGMRFDLRLAWATGRPYEGRAAEIIKDNLKSVGINVKIETLDRLAFIDKVFRSWNFDLANQLFTTGPDPTISVTTRFATSQILRVPFVNAMGYSNPALDALFDAEYKQLDRDKRAQMWREIQKIVMTDMPALPLFEVPIVNALTAGFHDVITGPQGYIENHERAFLSK
ncbi:MAG: ABC transporter substrate-binding protein [Hyphomicrobiaceae bacterium]